MHSRSFGELGGTDGSTPKNCSDREERQDIFSSGQQIYLRLFIDGKISLGVVPSVPLSSRPLISTNLSMKRVIGFNYH